MTRLWFLNTLVTVGVSNEQGGDGISVLESLAPHGDSPPLHVHHDEDEVFHILEGELRFRVGDDELRAGPGETLLAPKGVPHTYRVESDEAHWLVITTPAGFDGFVRAVADVAPAEELPPAGRPVDPAAMADAAARFGIELLGPPGTLPA